jgi:mitochondrial fission protein ELM1
VSRIWALLSDREGDNAQVLAVAEALGWPFETRRFQNRTGALVANLLAGPRFPALVKRSAGDFAAPWPDLVLAAGTQSEPICALLRRWTQRDGHRLRQVFLGRPWMNPQTYDLVVTTPQYRVPPADNVLEIDLPLHRVSRVRVATEAARWAPRLADLPKPYIAVLLGGAINRYSFDSRAAKRIAFEAGALAAASGGSLLICGSFRTPPQAIAVIADTVTVPTRIFDWQAAKRDNPYLGFLGLADAIVVTGDSMTMLAEACATGKPVHIFDLGEGRYSMRESAEQHIPVATTHPGRMNALRARAKHLKVQATRAILPVRLHRDTSPIHRKLIESGRAVWLGDDFPQRAAAPARDQVAMVAARVRGLLADAAAPAPMAAANTPAFTADSF